jgi:hypothetical protein
MVTLDTAMHLAGIACLVILAGLSCWILAGDLVGKRHRILAALRGEPISPAASGAPHAPALLPQHRSVEATAVPAIQVRHAR